MKSLRACTFCCAETLRSRNRVVYEDAMVIAMEDHNPRASRHLLVMPHEHIPSIDDLTPVHYDLLQHMLTTGTQLLAKDGYTEKANCRFGFHRPPFASVKHLHMHCLGLPFLPAWNRLRFTESLLPSYISAESALESIGAKRGTLDSTSSTES